MKNYIKYITIIFINVVYIACQDVVDVDVPEEPPRLVIEASIDWEKGTAGNEQIVKLSTSTPYFEALINTIVTGASVKVTRDSDQMEFIFQDQNDGTYKASNFVAELNSDYTLEVIYNNETYIARETLMPVTNIDDVVQSLEGGFDDEVIDVTIYFQDPIDEENYYLIKWFRHGDLFKGLNDISDEFINGNLIDVFIENEDEKEFVPGDVLDIDLLGISEQYHNYIRLLIEQYDSGADPYSTTPAAIKGNCVNLNNPDNFAFGYFRLTEVDRVTYTIQ